MNRLLRRITVAVVALPVAATGVAAHVSASAPPTDTPGSPADSAEVGLSLAFDGELPDLVISGPNAGANIANASIHSGTVGAAVTAANEGVAAIDLDYSEVALPAVGESVEATGAFVVTPTVDDASDAAAIEDGMVAITFIVGNYDAVAPSAELADQIAALIDLFSAG